MDKLAIYCQVLSLPEDLLPYIEIHFAGEQIHQNEYKAPDGNLIKFTARFTRGDLEEMKSLRDGLSRYIKAWDGDCD